MPKDEKDAKKKEEEPEESDSDSDTEDKQPFNLKYVSKLSFFAFILFVMINSDVFVERVLARASSSLVDGRSPTLAGVLVGGLVMSVMLIGIAYAVAMEKL